MTDDFSTRAPISLYGGTKLASEAMALEYGEAFDFPVWINRCGVLAGAGQFGTPDQGIFCYWINAHSAAAAASASSASRPGQQVRDAFHPRDLAAFVIRQLERVREAARKSSRRGRQPRTPCLWRN